MGAEPEVAVGLAEDGVDTTMRQPMLGRPGVEVVLRQGMVRVEREHLLGIHTGAARRAKEREDQPKDDMTKSLHVRACVVFGASV